MRVVPATGTEIGSVPRSLGLSHSCCGRREQSLRFKGVRTLRRLPHRALRTDVLVYVLVSVTPAAASHGRTVDFMERCQRQQVLSEAIDAATLSQVKKMLTMIMQKKIN